MHNMSGYLSLLLVKAPLTKTFFQYNWWGHTCNWEGQYNVNTAVAMYMTSVVLPFASPYNNVLPYCPEIETSPRGTPSHFTMQRIFPMSGFVTTVLPWRYVLICASFPLLNRFICCFFNTMRVRITENRYKRPVQLVLCTIHNWMSILT